MNEMDPAKTMDSMKDLDPATRTELEAAAFRRLLDHLRELAPAPISLLLWQPAPRGVHLEEQELYEAGGLRLALRLLGLWGAVCAVCHVSSIPPPRQCWERCDARLQFRPL